MSTGEGANDSQRWLDDFSVGETFSGPPRPLTRQDFEYFSLITGDRQAIHFDDAYAQARGLPGAAAHGLHLLATCALGATPMVQRMHDSIVAMAGSTVRFKRAAIAGDTLHPEFEVAGVEPKGEARGILRLAFRLYNQRHELLLEGEHQVMVRRKPA